MATTTKYPVKVGLSTLDREMTQAQAQRWADSHMPRDLKRVGFDALVSLSDPEIHGGAWLRVNYAKRVAY